MTCRHQLGDPTCTAGKSPSDLRKKAQADYDRWVVPASAAGDQATRYDVLDVVQVGPHLALKVEYPNCPNCSYEGIKVMVVLNCLMKDALRWKRLDPHFFEGKTTHDQAPSPAARFQPTDEGWKDALAYAKSKAG